MTDPMELADWLERQGARHRPNADKFTEAAACIRELVDSREGLSEDLYQAVLVAYRRGATDELSAMAQCDCRGPLPSPPADRGGV